MRADLTGNSVPLKESLKNARVSNLAAITKLNSILWDRDMTPKTKTHIYHAMLKSTITHGAKHGV